MRHWIGEQNRSLSVSASASQEHRFFILSPEEEVWLYQRLTKQCFDSFQKSQIAFYEDLLAAWEVPLTAIAPQIMGNYLLSLIIVRNNAPTSLPFLFHEYLDETAALQIRLFIDHLESCGYKAYGKRMFFLAFRACSMYNKNIITKIIFGK